MPIDFQTIILGQNTKFVFYDEAQYQSKFGCGRAISIGCEIYAPFSVSEETLRHELSHIVEHTALSDSPNLRDKSILNRGYFSTDKYSGISSDWREAVDKEIADKKHVSGMFGWKHHNDVLYDGDESMIGYLIHTGQDKYPEAFAEIGRKYLSLYSLHDGDIQKVNEILPKTYPHLWPVFRDEAMNQALGADITKMKKLSDSQTACMTSDGGHKFDSNGSVTPYPEMIQSFTNSE